MILTCENCHTRYLVPNDSLGREGREVRCMSCQHQWFQEPDPFVAPQQQFEPIPEAVRPIPDGSALPAIRTADGKAAARAESLARKAAVAIFLIIFAGLIMGRGKIVHAWLPSITLYAAMHMAPALPGQGLVFDQISASVAPDAQGVNALTVKGQIVNPTNKVVKIPPVQASLLRMDGGKVDGWQIDLKQPDIAPNGKTEFQTVYPDVPKDAKEIRLNLLLMH